MKRLSWKYVAGLFDGDGCIDFGKYQKEYKYITPRIRVTLTEPGFDVLNLLINNYGGYIDKKSNKKINPKWTDSKTWVITGKRTRTILQNIKNHLIIKKGQAILLIWFIDNLLGKRLPEEILDSVYQEMKLRKKDPHRLSVPPFLKDAIVETRKVTVKGALV